MFSKVTFFSNLCAERIWMFTYKTRATAIFGYIFINLRVWIELTFLDLKGLSLLQFIDDLIPTNKLISYTFIKFNSSFQFLSKSICAIYEMSWMLWIFILAISDVSKDNCVSKLVLINAFINLMWGNTMNTLAFKKTQKHSKTNKQKKQLMKDITDRR